MTRSFCSAAIARSYRVRGIEPDRRDGRRLFVRGGRLTNFQIQHDLIDAPDRKNLAIEPEDSAHNSEPRALGRRLRRSVRIDAEV